LADLDAQVRAADPDRWLSSRFVGDAQARADLMALYAFEAELNAIHGRVSQPMLAEMRFAWWREQMGGVFEGAPRRGHPVLEALADVVARRGLTRTPFDALIEAQIGRAHREPHDLQALFVGPMRLAARVLTEADQDAAVDEAAMLWAETQTGQFEQARGRRNTANAALGALPAPGFPAVAHAALIRPDEPEPLKRLRLVWATARGRI
jgi:15-cis-phytoene synthase